MSTIFNVTEHVVGASHIREYPRATADSQDQELRLHVKQYVPKDNPHPRKGDLTVIGAHANGFPKELYEPLWDDFYHEAAKLGIRIRAIWIADAAWQGRSGVLNQGKLGNDPSWNDYARDIVHMVNTFRMPRPLLAVGHSFGGNVLTNVALLHPRLFSGLVLLDPVISNFDGIPGSLFRGPAALSARRRHVWPSRAHAAEAFSRSPFYRAWDPRALERWVRYGLRSVSASGEDEREAQGQDGGEVTLATTRDQECGHLVPMEAPRDCAREAAAWARTELDRWWAEERRFEEWAARPPGEKAAIGREFMERLGEPSGRQGKTMPKI
ncbi:hypothetical protein HIM_01856 [Hirsutella minnesotensis 3608]|nr:hypothetical protein HIM_01856 [Hirsutella minnesotensis 3608]